MNDRKESVTSTAVLSSEYDSKGKNGEIQHNDAPNAFAMETAEERDARIAARATLQNVLHGIPKAQLFAEVDEFCKVHQLQDQQEIYRKGALLAQSPHDWNSLVDLDEGDKAAAAYELAHK
jgi:hypothetical protein